MKFCLFCGKPVKNKYCNVSCQNSHQNANKFAGRKLKRNKKICEVCGRLISFSTFDRHKCNLSKLKFTKEEMSNSHKGNKSRTGWKNTDQQKEKARIFMLGRYVGDKNSSRRKEVREKLSKAACKNHKGGWKHVPYIDYKLRNQKTIKLRGSYEISFAEFLDKNEIEWIYQKPLSYIDENGIKRYLLPDFYIPVLDKYFDTKGHLTELCKHKLGLLKSQKGIAVNLVFESDLKCMKDGLKWLK